MRSFAPAIAALLFAAVAAGAQTSAQSDSARTGPINVYLDCESHYCDFDFFRTEITAVNWVRDRQVADVHILVSTQSTGAGGTEFTLAFLGLRQVAGVGDTLRYISKPASVQDEVRRGLAQVIKAGLVPYVARTAGYDRITITFAGPQAARSDAPPQRDRWNYWVFRAALNGFGNGSSSNRFVNSWSSLSANRVTEAWKTSISFNGNYDESRFELSDGTTFTAVQRNYNVELLQVKSLGAHWSAGVTGGMFSSTYSNQDRVIRVSPAVEYNLYPYKESTRRQLRFQYSIGPSFIDYADTTIFNKVSETRLSHELSASLGLRQPWGTVSVSASHRNLLDDFSKRSENVGGDISWRIIRGLSFNIGGHYSQVRDQIHLAKEDATDEQILVRQKELATSYRYFVNFGVSYTFGSIFNNVVNPRFGGGGF